MKNFCRLNKVTAVSRSYFMWLEVTTCRKDTVVCMLGFTPHTLRAIYKADNFVAERGGRLFRPSEPLEMWNTADEE
jgi:hypothetical protein